MINMFFPAQKACNILISSTTKKTHKNFTVKANRNFASKRNTRSVEEILDKISVKLR